MDSPPSGQPPVEYYGSHGTSRSRGNQIQKEGFTIGDDSGRRGKGIYLWRRCRNWSLLAKGWYMQKKSWGSYAGDSNSQGMVVYAIARVPEDHYIDLRDQEALDAIDELADQAHIDKWDKVQIAAVYERYIGETEAKLGNPIDIYETEVAPPERKFCPEYSIKLLGAPKCYCVRKSSVLTPDDFEEF